MSEDFGSDLPVQEPYQAGSATPYDQQMAGYYANRTELPQNEVPDLPESPLLQDQTPDQPKGSINVTPSQGGYTVGMDLDPNRNASIPDTPEDEVLVDAHGNIMSPQRAADGGLGMLPQHDPNLTADFDTDLGEPDKSEHNPWPTVFPAKIIYPATGTADASHQCWKEQSNVNGVMADYPDGRKCNDATHASAGLDPFGAPWQVGDNVTIVESFDGQDHRYEIIQTRPLSVADDQGMRPLFDNGTYSVTGVATGTYPTWMLEFNTAYRDFVMTINDAATTYHIAWAGFTIGVGGRTGTRVTGLREIYLDNIDSYGYSAYGTLSVTWVKVPIVTDAFSMDLQAIVTHYTPTGITTSVNFLVPGYSDHGSFNVDAFGHIFNVTLPHVVAGTSVDGGGP